MSDCLHVVTRVAAYLARVVDSNHVLALFFHCSCSVDYALVYHLFVRVVALVFYIEIRVGFIFHIYELMTKRAIFWFLTLLKFQVQFDFYFLYFDRLAILLLLLRKFSHYRRFFQILFLNRLWLRQKLSLGF